MVRYSVALFMLQRSCLKSSQWAAAQRGMWGLVLIPPSNYCRKFNFASFLSVVTALHKTCHANHVKPSVKFLRVTLFWL